MNALHRSPSDLAGDSNLTDLLPAKSAHAIAEPRFRLAIVGAGMAGGVLHLPAALASELVEVVALVDPTLERAEALARDYGLQPEIGRRIEDLRSRIDGAIIATPNDTHREIAVACAERGINCLIEKPLAATVEGAEAICRAAEEHGIVVASGYATRFCNQVVLLKHLLDSGYFGAIRRFDFQDGNLGGWSPFSGYNLDRKASGGGVLVVTGTHFLDRLLYWFGYPDECDITDDATDGPEAQCLANVRYRGQGRHFDGTIRLSKLYALKQGLVIDAEKGLAILGLGDSPLLFQPHQDPRLQIELRPRGEPYFAPEADSFQLQIEDFVAACRQRRPPLIDGRQGLLSVRLVDQLYSRRKRMEQPWEQAPQATEPRKSVFATRPSDRVKVAVFGASGFVGSTLVERLRGNGADVVAAIHYAGSAWRLARNGTPLRIVDIMARPAIAEALRGCTHVVNCTRGSDEVMIGGLQNLLAEAKAQGIRRFVHLSSVAVYGDPPPPESIREECEPRPQGDYGPIKLRQDEIVARAHADGLSCAVLCPPNISGVYSPFVCSVLEDMRRGSLALVEDGGMPINVVDVDNLCHAIELALTADQVDGRRIFVTDGDAITWRDFTGELAPLAELSAPLPSLARSAITPNDMPPPRGSLFRAIRHLVSSDVRRALRADPLLGKVDAVARDLARKLPGPIEEKLRLRIEGPLRVAKVPTRPKYDSRFNPQQLRNVTHSCDRAARVLGYTRVIEFRDSMARFRQWYVATRGMAEESWPQIRELLKA